MENIINEEIVKYIDKYFNLYGLLPNNPQEKDYYLKDRIKKAYHHLFDHIDWELKKNDELNRSINILVEYKKVIDYDEEKYFYYLDDLNRPHFDKVRKDEAELFVNSWPAEREKIIAGIEHIESKKHFKSLYKNQLIKLKNALDYGDSKFQRLDKIFALGRQQVTIDENYKKEAKALEDKIYEVIDEVVFKYICESLKASPEVVFAKRAFKRGEYDMQSSAFLSSSENKNLNKFFNDKYLKNILDNIYNEYIKYKETEKQQNEKI